ncbi:MAG: hypothetical protein ABIJ21_03525 [Nanoarchaeota archaeon]
MPDDNNLYKPLPVLLVHYRQYLHVLVQDKGCLRSKKWQTTR